MYYSYRAKAVSIYDKLYSFWSSSKTEKNIGSIIVLVYLADIILIFLNKTGIFPEKISQLIHLDYFNAINVAFNLLLFFEVVSLVFILPKSFSGSLLKQFEILSLILLRHAFDYLKIFEGNIVWDNISADFYHMMSNASASLLIFGGILIIKRLQLHRDVTKSEEDRQRFIELKKIVSFILIIIFSYLLLDEFYLFLTSERTFNFFKTFYTVLVFADIFMVLLSLRYSQSYIVLFRNSGFAFATVLIRIALSSPVYIDAVIGISAVIFTIILTYIYSNYKLC